MKQVNSDYYKPVTMTECDMPFHLYSYIRLTMPYFNDNGCPADSFKKCKFEKSKQAAIFLGFWCTVLYPHQPCTTTTWFFYKVTKNYRIFARGI